jgi:hypothetical protein
VTDFQPVDKAVLKEPFQPLFAKERVLARLKEIKKNELSTFR